jgi:hypothetical protein
VFLGHVIGVRIPASQPHNFTARSGCSGPTLRVSALVTRFGARLRPPDGTRICFASESTLSGGWWAVAATGGEPQLMMKDAGAPQPFRTVAECHG